MKSQSRALGYLLALFTVIVWGTTFIASKRLLEFYTPLQVLFVRFLLAYGALWLVRPRRFSLSRREELRFLLLGIFGCSLYFLTENSALTYTLASNVSIIVSAAPIFTAILAHFTTDEKFRANTFWGFVAAFSGVTLVVFNGAFVLKLSPKGDLLALAAALCWAVYSVLMKEFAGKYDSILITRRILFWGIVTALPLILTDGIPFPTTPIFSDWVIPCSFLFLGLAGSAVCYIFWNEAFRILGIVATNSWIYTIPFITIVAASLVLHERISPAAIAGAVLITVGVIVAEYSPKRS